MRSNVINASSGKYNYDRRRTQLIDNSAAVTRTLLDAESGTLFLVDLSTVDNDITLTLPTASGSLTGMVMSWDIADVGTMTIMNENVATVGWSNPAAADHQFSSNKTTTGGLAGTYLKYTCITSALWHVEGYTFCSSGASIATPFT